MSTAYAFLFIPWVGLFFFFARFNVRSTLQFSYKLRRFLLHKQFLITLAFICN